MLLMARNGHIAIILEGSGLGYGDLVEAELVDRVKQDLMIVTLFLF